MEQAASSERLRELATSWHLPGILLLDPAGRETQESRPVSPAALAHLREVLRGQGEIAFDFSRSLSEGEFLGYLAYRKAGLPRVVLLLDRAALRYWASRLAIQDAVEALGWRRGVAYVAVVDPAGRFLAQRGEVPESSAGVAKLPAVGAGQKEHPSHRRFTLGNRKILEVVAPFRLAGEAAGTARVGLEADNLDRLLRQTRSRIFQTAGLMLGIGLLAVAALYVAQNRHHRRLRVVTERLHQAERLSALGKLAAGLAHEIRNPLNAIGLAAQRIQREHPQADGEAGAGLGRLTTVIREEVRRLNRLIEDFLNLSPPASPKLEPRSLVALLQEILPLVEEEARVRGIRVETTLPELRCRVRVDPDRLKQALLNLLRNALEAIPAEGPDRAVRVRVEPRGAREVSLRIEDTGVGIPLEDLGRVFDPDFTTKEKGLGLGLPMAHEIVRAHGGQLRVLSEPGAGTAFELLLPCEPQDP
jgi:signal transduction histidine kinase